MLGKLVVGEIAVGEVVTGETVLGKLRWGNNLTPHSMYYHMVGWAGSIQSPLYLMLLD